jgi:uncharacterized membrane protein YcaP (DUF421 family)
VLLLSHLGATWERLLVVVVAGVAAYVLVIVLTRIAGVRSLAKMSTFDFAATVAVGSTVSSILTGSVPLAAGALGLVVLFALQYLIAVLRRHDLLGGVVDNRPILLMAGAEVLEDNMRHARMSREELWSQLRLSGVHRREQVQCVIMETTGDVTVLQNGDPLDDELLEGVRGADRLR